MHKDPERAKHANTFHRNGAENDRALGPVGPGAVLNKTVLGGSTDHSQELIYLNPKLNILNTAKSYASDLGSSAAYPPLLESLCF